MKKVNISQVLTQVLVEQGNQEARGIDWKNSGTLLSNVLQNCQGELKALSSLAGTSVKPMDQSSPKNTAGLPLMNRFKDVANMKLTSIGYVGGDVNGNKVIVFGVQDPNVKEPALLGYTLQAGAEPQRIPNGVAPSCKFIQSTSKYGTVELSPVNQSKLNDFIETSGGLYTQFDPKNNMMYRQIPLRNLKDRDDRPLFTEDPGDGFVWMKVEGGEQNKYGATADKIDKVMTDQGFITDFTDVDPSSSQAQLSFYLKDVIKDLPGMQIDPNVRQNKAFMPDPNKINIDPDKGTCRDVIKTLWECSQEKSPTDKCTRGLFARKMTALACRNKNFIGGAIGLKDEFEKLQGNYTSKGLGNLANALGKVKMQELNPNVQQETIEKRINKILNEEHKKFTFNHKTPKFDRQVVENLATQLVLSALFDLNRDLKKIKLNESLGDVTSALGFDLGGKLWQGGKELIAKKVISALGFDPKSYLALLITNIFANVDIKDYMDVLSNCKKYTAVIVKSALEAWLDKAMASMGTSGSGGIGIESFVYSALKNTVTETAANTTIYAKLEKAALNIVCPLIEGITSSVKSGDISLF